MTAEVVGLPLSDLQGGVVSLDATATVPARRRSRVETILLATDLSPVSEGATDEAIELCRALGARLVVMNVIDTRHGIVAGLLPAARVRRMDQLRTECEGVLLGVVKRARSVGVDASFLIWTGDAGQGIVSAAEAERADIVVVGTRALDRAGRFLLGSVSDYVVNNSSSPVLIAR